MRKIKVKVKRVSVPELRGAVVVGYPGIGKSSLACRDGKFIDLESSVFSVRGKKSDDWYIMYCQVALDLAQQGHVVFVSAHEEVCNYLLSHPIPKNVFLACCTPDVNLKDAWTNKLHKRFLKTELEKDFRAYQHVKEYFEQDVETLLRRFDFSIVLRDMDYDLADIEYAVLPKSIDDILD